MNKVAAVERETPAKRASHKVTNALADLVSEKVSGRAPRAPLGPDETLRTGLEKCPLDSGLHSRVYPYIYAEHSQWRATHLSDWRTRKAGDVHCYIFCAGVGSQSPRKGYS
jgi:hypothetical protein